MGFGVKLHGEKGEFSVRNSLDGVVVQAAKTHLPIARQRFFVDGVAVVLRGEQALFFVEVETRMVLSSVSELEFVGFAADGER